jgi:uncharacterized protein (TIGR00288 family)
MDESKQKIALFIDADNAPASKFEDVLSEVAKYGVVTIRKAYGNWKNASLKPWEALLHEYAIQPVQQYDLSKGKNASDIALVIDAMDVMYTKNIDVMCFVSSDCDFTPLVTRALAEGKVVLGFGERKTPSPFVNACSKFLFLDQESKQNGTVQTKSKNIKSDTKLINLLRQAIESTEEDKLPSDFVLKQNYPNPFNPSTMIEFSIKNNSKVNLSIYDVLGRKVTTLINGNLQAGTHEVNFEGQDISSGIYFYSLTVGNAKVVKKMTFAK